MFDSVCLGLSYYEEKRKTAGKETLDGIFFSRWMCRCLRHLRWNMKNTGLRKAMGCLSPGYEKTPGHPLLIRADVIEKLLQHDGTMGLKGACEQPGIRRIPLDVPDPAVRLMRIRRKSFRNCVIGRKRPVPDKEECERLLAWFHTPEATVRHSRAVAELAVELADRVLKHRAERCVEMTYKSPQSINTKSTRRRFFMTSPKHTPNIQRQGRDGCGFWDIPGSRISLRIIWICRKKSWDI